MIPTLHTDRLLLRGFTPEDGPRIELLAGDHRVAGVTLNIPHPYPVGGAQAWLATIEPAYAAGERVNFAVQLRGGELIGCVGLGLSLAHERGELGYWLGVDYWGHGYMTEAAAVCMRFGFEHFGLKKIEAHYFAGNPASGRVMQKLGMKPEGTQRRHIKRDGVFHDTVLYGVLREEFLG